MAVLWQRKVDTNHYEVRTAGRSIRLYKNKVFHSQWNSRRPLSNGVWDLLFLPALFLPRVRRVLVLGVGGGAVINQFNALLAPEKIVGVELDSIHLQVARRFFGVKKANVELHNADALQWLADYRGEKFDIIIEDLFTEQEGEPVRVASADQKWFRLLLRHLSSDGALVVNFEDSVQMRNSTEDYRAACGINRADIRYQFNQPSYGNSVCAYLPIPVTAAMLRSRLDEKLEGYPDCRSSGQKFRLRKVN